MDIRAPTAADADRIGELVESSMTASYRLSPQQIAAIVDSEFGADAVARRADDGASVVRVAESDEGVESATVVGYVEGRVDGDRGELTWLFVDPEHRGRGVGTELFESARGELREAGASEVAATSLEANADGHRFFERFGMERVDDREVDLADESLVAAVYASSASDGTDQSGADLPATETRDGATTATTADGERVFLARDERDSGTEAPFLPAYTDEAHADRFGYYCANCGSLGVAMDDAERLDCPDCANAHAARSSDSYDDSYL